MKAGSILEKKAALCVNGIIEKSIGGTRRKSICDCGRLISEQAGHTNIQRVYNASTLIKQHLFY